MLVRDYYCDKIVPYIDKHLIKVLVGQRRVGKSFVLKMIADHILLHNSFANIVFINKEDFAFDSIIDAASLVQYVESHLCAEKKNYLFIDEIQDIDGFEKALRSFLSKGQCDIYCTGSNARILSGELSTYLSGRYIEFRIYGLSYGEFLTFHRLSESEASFAKYIEFGGLPYLTELELQENLVAEYHKNIYTSILLKDIVARENIRNVSFLEKLSRFLADSVGSQVSALSISNYLKSQQTKINPSVILNYLRAMSNAYIIDKVSRFDIQGKKIFEFNDKYYFEDAGIRNALVGFSFVRDIHKLLENVVYRHLCFCGFEVFVGKFGDKEIDFVARRQNRYLYVQVAYLLNDPSTVAREFGNLESIKDNYPKYVVSMDNSFGNSDFNGIEHYSVRRFLLTRW